MAEAPDEGFRVTDRRRRDASSDVDSPGALHERSLIGLFVMLASQALIALGDAPDPVTGQRQRQLTQASDVIDLLSLLRDKTEGHRSAEETHTLDDLIYDLQLRYVQAVKSPAG